jgi:LysR family transcriptional regulator, hca operon transcriptional activator
MELRHLRYFVAVAEAGSLTVAAGQILHTTQPSLSRQMNDLETEVGAQLFIRSVRGIELTAAGRVFLDHARVVLSQVEIAVESARRLADPAKPYFVLGFLTGHESTWLPEALQLLRDELPNIHVVVSSQVSPQLAVALLKGSVDAAFLRREEGTSDLEFRLLAKEPLEVFMPSDHRLAALDAIDPQEIIGETFLSVSGTALSGLGRPPALRIVIDAYLKQCGITIKPSHEVDNLAGVMSLITSTRGVALLPTYVKNLLPGAVTSRPLKGRTPTIDLCLGYKKDNPSPVLQVFLSRFDEFVARVANKGV